MQEVSTRLSSPQLSGFIFEGEFFVVEGRQQKCCFPISLMGEYDQMVLQRGL